MRRHSKQLRVGATLLAAIGLAACDENTPRDVPEVAGTYAVTWTVQVLRRSDGAQTQFSCGGRLTLSEAPATSGVVPLSGFITASPPCAPESYNLSGTVASGGVVDFRSGGPPPEAGCPGGRNVHFAGQLERTGGALSLSARGAVEVQCPDAGGYMVSYLLAGRES